MVKTDGPSWKFRRGLFFTVTTVAFVGIFGILLGIFAPPASVLETALWGFFVLIGTVLGAYTAGATWEDVKLFPKKPNTSVPDKDNHDYDV